MGTQYPIMLEKMETVKPDFSHNHPYNDELREWWKTNRAAWGNSPQTALFA
jgi:hypothetical protein